MSKCIIVFVAISLIIVKVEAQYHATLSDSLGKKLSKDSTLSEYHFNAKQLIIPSTLIGYGILALTVKPIKNLNKSTADEILEDKTKGNNLDNYTQYLPAAMVYGFNAFGLKGKHNFQDRTILLATSQLISAGMILPIKHLVKEERPDHSNNLSFPSGHTTTAFSTATFLFMEYKDENFWLSLSGYPLAIFTGVYRVINNKHWVGDVVTGAGFGILSTEMAYWAFPAVNKLFKKKDKPANNPVMFYPSIQYRSYGVGLVKNF